MKQLLEAMRNISFVNEWYELGLCLQVSDVDLEIFKVDSATDVAGRCQKMLQKWLGKKSNASWSQLVTALDKIELHTAAKAVSEYCKSGSLCIHTVHQKFQDHKSIFNLLI